MSLLTIFLRAVSGHTAPLYVSPGKLHRTRIVLQMKVQEITFHAIMGRSVEIVDIVLPQ